MADPRKPDFLIHRSELASFVKDPGVIRKIEALQRAVNETTPADIATAQTTADTAVTNAAAAQATANTAETDAQTGITKANAAQTTATSAATAAAAAQTTANSKLSDAPSDGSTYGRKNGAWSAIASGGSAAWTLISQSGASTTGSTWTWSTNVASVNVTGLGSYNEVIVIAKDITLSASGNRVVKVSVDGGTTFFSTSGDNISYSTVGAASNSVAILGNSATASTAASSVIGQFSLKGPVKRVIKGTETTNSGLFVASASDINAIQLAGTAGNLTGGTLYVYAR